MSIEVSAAVHAQYREHPGFYAVDDGGYRFIPGALLEDNEVMASLETTNFFGLTHVGAKKIYVRMYLSGEKEGLLVETTRGATVEAESEALKRVKEYNRILRLIRENEKKR